MRYLSITACSGVPQCDGVRQEPAYQGASALHAEQGGAQRHKRGGSQVLNRRTPAGRSDSSASDGFRASNLQRRLSGDESEGSAVATRPKPAGQVAPKQPAGEPSHFQFRFYEAVARDLTQPAKSSRPSTSAVRQPDTVARPRRSFPACTCPLVGRIPACRCVRAHLNFAVEAA